MADGLETEIGERGVNLSGGQKARVSLARACFSGAELIVLDDPLSAVDPHVAKVLFEKCITGLMKGKTVILATHQIQFLRNVEKIIWVDQNRIKAIGDYKDIKDAGLDFDELM